MTVGHQREISIDGGTYLDCLEGEGSYTEELGDLGYERRHSLTLTVSYGDFLPEYADPLEEYAQLPVTLRAADASLTGWRVQDIRQDGVSVVISVVSDLEGGD